MKGSFESKVTMPSGVIYSCKISKGYYSNVLGQHEKTYWLERENSKYNTESVLICLSDRGAFISVYINSKDATGILQPTDKQLLKLLDSSLSIEDTFEYCRKTFCSDLLGIGTKPKVEKKQRAAIAQPDLFEMV